jgi:hypothetical protein
MRVLEITMPNGSQWNVPVEAIARNHAEYYATHESSGDVEKCLREHSLPLLMADKHELRDWASGNMNWADVASVAFLAAAPTRPAVVDFQEGWVNGEYRVLDVEPAAVAGPDTSGWVRADLKLPDASKVSPCRRGAVETAGRDSQGDWCFRTVAAHTVQYVEQYCLFWRYLPAAPT